MARTCIFCGGRADSHEHVWPKWILALGEQGHAIQGHTGSKPFLIHGPNAELKTRHVCRVRCNNGWMSRLEARTSPVMTPLILDQASTLTEKECAVIARWMFKTAMVSERTSPKENWYFSADERTAMMNGSGIPLLATAWIGRYDGRWSPFTGGVVLGADEKDTPTGVAYTITVGRLAMQLVAVRQIDDRLVVVRSNRGPWRGALRQVWPFVEPVNWPPPIGFDDTSGITGLRWLLARFNRKNLPLPFPI
jgi:hypothetical protein